MGKRGQKQGIHSQVTRKKIFRIFLIQAAIAVFVSGGLLLIDIVTAYSTLLGAALYLIPNLYFANRALKSRPGQSPNTALVELYASEIWKMGISIVAFAAVFILVEPLSPFSLFVTFILMQISGWIAQMNLNNRFLKL
ncbi:ATP synthase subunit I [Pontibacterium granulatum]|uniref:ATP synthase subunit I n=1 Tax=Pontibacterium granulatum TaxID=2036029 RepID=UPI00249A7B2A|nr:ATP synthase subunit I [Pontibacterium granulatum]MDI3324171.1 ATP synthase subunit I [Pontibacterium granulatum]